MKKFLVMALIAVVSAAGLALAPAPSAQAAPKKQCIYMVANVEKWGDEWDFSYIVWKKTGRKIVGVIGATYLEPERQRLTYQPRKKRAVGVQVNAVFGGRERVVSRTVGKGKTLRVKTYQRVDKARMAELTPGYRLGVPGCKA